MAWENMLFVTTPEFWQTLQNGGGGQILMEIGFINTSDLNE